MRASRKKQQNFPAQPENSADTACIADRSLRISERCRSGDAGNAESPLLTVSGLTKHFGPNIALDSVSFSVYRNEVIGFVGENGAGKSTLLNILSGMLTQDAGQMHLSGEKYQPNGYGAACKFGISRVFQEQALILNVPVYENLLLWQESRFVKAGLFLDRKGLMSMFAELPGSTNSRDDRRSRSYGRA